jgi:hypothetical protein
LGQALPERPAWLRQGERPGVARQQSAEASLVEPEELQPEELQPQGVPVPAVGPRPAVSA